MVGKKSMIIGVLILSLPLVRTALAQGTPSIDWWVIGSGGGSARVSNNSLEGTIGQWVVGSDRSGTIQLSPGFWGGGWDESYSIYLPVTLRGFP